jgi:C_GCAxxG_C_C family probable redox protein
MLKEKEEKAIRSFRNGLNCAQAVVSAYTEELKFDPALALSLSCGFGGGMGRLQQTCGAVTGAFMVLGIYNCRKHTDNKERKDKTYGMIQEFSSRFQALHGAIDCRTLLGCDLRTEEGQQYLKEHALHDTICEYCICDALKISDELMQS